MRTRRVLQMCLWLAGVGIARSPSPTQSPAPEAQVGVLTEGLLHLLSGIEENGRFVERQGRRVNRELRRQARELARLHTRARLVDRLWTGLKRELQVGEAREEGLQREAEGLQREVEALRDMTGRDTLEHRLSRVQEMIQVITAPGAVKATTLNTTLLQAEMEAQGRRLSDLSLEVMIQDGLVAQQDQRHCRATDGELELEDDRGKSIDLSC
ncbi:hypothetical protein SKAU_G00285390 [Synaphobranchus kaupii]|uniref:Uncharacterized protein n=1 Tax=Synaphobranchus kaupii TaxID=118154 RepID=A0A9Q1IPE7_SYNKA|nr:hypothetical protein SKAU_G00285390 [Synaphobranchus kaupii]